MRSKVSGLPDVHTVFSGQAQGFLNVKFGCIEAFPTSEFIEYHSQAKQTRRRNGKRIFHDRASRNLNLKLRLGPVLQIISMVGSYKFSSRLVVVVIIISLKQLSGGCQLVPS